jgi:hypothetical protein
VTASNKRKKSLGYATQIMGKQLDTEIIKGDPMQYYLLPSI